MPPGPGQARPVRPPRSSFRMPGRPAPSPPAGVEPATKHIGAIPLQIRDMQVDLGMTGMGGFPAPPQRFERPLRRDGDDDRDDFASHAYASNGYASYGAHSTPPARGHSRSNSQGQGQGHARNPSLQRHTTVPARAGASPKHVSRSSLSHPSHPSQASLDLGSAHSQLSSAVSSHLPSPILATPHLSTTQLAPAPTHIYPPANSKPPFTFPSAPARIYQHSKEALSAPQLRAAPPPIFPPRRNRSLSMQSYHALMPELAAVTDLAVPEEDETDLPYGAPDRASGDSGSLRGPNNPASPRGSTGRRELAVLTDYTGRRCSIVAMRPTGGRKAKCHYDPFARRRTPTLPLPVPELDDRGSLRSDYSAGAGSGVSGVFVRADGVRADGPWPDEGGLVGGLVGGMAGGAIAGAGRVPQLV